MLRLMQITKPLHYLTFSPQKPELPCRADEDTLKAQCVLTVTKQMLFVMARVDAVPFKIITVEDIQQPWDRTLYFFFQQHATISGFNLKVICFHLKPPHSCKLQPARVTQTETFISCIRCLKYSSKFVLSTG